MLSKINMNAPIETEINVKLVQWNDYYIETKHIPNTEKNVGIKIYMYMLWVYGSDMHSFSECYI